MTKEITRANILQEIQDKFKLREWEAERFLFSETVIPMYDIEPHLLSWEVTATNKTVSGTGGVLYHTIPDNEKWALNGYDVIFVSGSYTVAGVYITRKKTGVSNFHYLDLAAAQSISYTKNLNFPIALAPGDKIYINIDGYTSTGSLQLRTDIAKETLR